MTSWFMLLGLLANAPVAGASVRVDVSADRASVRIQSETPLSAVDVERNGDEIVARIDGRFDGAQPQLPPNPLIRSLTVSNEGARFVARIRVAEAALHQISRDAQTLTILAEPRANAQAQDGARAGGPAIPAEELYARLFPVSPVVTGDAADLRMAGESIAGPGAPDSSRGLLLGRVTLLPWVTAGYVDAEYQPPGSASQRQRFFQIQPRLDATMPVGAGSARLGYEPRFRAGSSAPSLRKASHIADASLSLPLGGNLEVGLSEHFSHGALETDEVDPGREYYADLATFTSQQLQPSARFDLGANLNVRLAARLGTVRFARPSGFFDYDSRGASGDLGRELTPTLRLAAGVGYDQIDAPSRPEASMHSTSANVRLDGDLAPLTRGNISLGWTRQTNPSAPAEARRFDGLTTSATIRRELGYASSVALTGVRATHPSGFGDDGFFVTTAGQVQVALLLPFAVSFQGGTGYHVNQYRAVVPEIGRPRRDQITYWSVGLGRAVSRWGFWRVDYRREARDSNIDTFDHTVSAFSVRIGVGFLEEAKR